MLTLNWICILKFYKKAFSCFGCYWDLNLQGKEEEMTDEERATLAMDFDVGFAIKEKVLKWIDRH